MKKKIFALMLVFSLLLSFTLVLGSCNGNTEPTGDDLNINETVPGTGGTPTIDVIVDPDNSDAQAGEENNYIHN